MVFAQQNQRNIKTNITLKETKREGGTTEELSEDQGWAQTEQ